jgi:hypothetical protein
MPQNLSLNAPFADPLTHLFLILKQYHSPQQAIDQTQGQQYPAFFAYPIL